MNPWPLIDTDHPRQSPAYVTWGLMALLCAVYLVSLLRLPYESAIRLMLVPEHPQPLSLLAALFLHASGVHLLANLLLLWLFGRDVEDTVGSPGFLLLYLAGGLATNLAQIGAVRLFLPMEQSLPIIGASGAVAVVMGAFAGLFPHARLTRTAHRISPSNPPAGLSALWLWGVWIAAQGGLMLWDLLGGHQEIGSWGHVAGFIVGLGVGLSVARFSSRTVAFPTPEVSRKLSARTGSHHGNHPAAKLGTADRMEAKGNLEAARTLARVALESALEGRYAEEGLAAYRWLARRIPLAELDSGKRLELAALLENEGEIEGALEVLQRLVLEGKGESAASALLALSRIYGASLGDRHRAGEMLQVILTKYPHTQAGVFARVEQERGQLKNRVEDRTG